MHPCFFKEYNVFRYFTTLDSLYFLINCFHFCSKTSGTKEFLAIARSKAGSALVIITAGTWPPVACFV
ncbi:4882_t:CDS:2 [Gigaspora rosea]|nr:4882_t:CDS:2 [Gigaspora rosea]